MSDISDDRWSCPVCWETVVFDAPVDKYRYQLAEIQRVHGVAHQATGSKRRSRYANHGKLLVLSPRAVRFVGDRKAG